MQRLEVSGAVRALYGSLCVKGLITSFFFCRNHAVRKIMWKKYCRAGQATGDNIIRRMRFAFSITKATNTHSEYVMHFFFPPGTTIVARNRLNVTSYVQCLSCPMLSLLLLWILCFEMLSLYFIYVSECRFSERLMKFMPEVVFCWTD